MLKVSVGGAPRVLRMFQQEAAALPSEYTNLQSNVQRSNVQRSTVLFYLLLGIRLAKSPQEQQIRENTCHPVATDGPDLFRLCVKSDQYGIAICN